MDRVVGQGVRVVGVGVPAREAEDPLRQEIAHGMPDASRVPDIVKCCGSAA